MFLKNIENGLYEFTDWMLQKQYAHHVMEYSRKKGLKYYPVTFEGLLDIEDEVKEYIMSKARQDLPESQFTKHSIVSWPDDAVEIGGMLGFNGEPYEIAYANKCELLPGWGAKVSYKVDSDKLKKGTILLIGWHTHPRIDPYISERDAENGNVFVNQVGVMQYCEIIFHPYTLKFDWYEYRKVIN